MKYIAAFGMGVIILLLILLSEALFNYKCPRYLLGWFACTGWYEVIRYYDRNE